MSRYNYAALLVLINSILFGIITTCQSTEISIINIFGNGATNFLIMISIIAPGPAEFKYTLDTAGNKKNIYIILLSLFSIFVSFSFRIPYQNTSSENIVKICFSLFSVISIIGMIYLICLNRDKYMLLSFGTIIILCLLFLITFVNNEFSILLSTFLANIGGAFFIPYTLFSILIISSRFINKYFE